MNTQIPSYSNSFIPSFMILNVRLCTKYVFVCMYVCMFVHIIQFTHTIQNFIYLIVYCHVYKINNNSNNNNKSNNNNNIVQIL